MTSSFTLYLLSRFWKSANLGKSKSLNNVNDIRTKAGLGKDLEKSC